MASGNSTSDTSADALAAQLDRLRRMSPQERLNKSLAWSLDIRQMAFNAIRRRHPTLDEAEVRLRFIELVYGQELADDVRRWQMSAGRRIPVERSR
jgi:hypothetical protein